MTRGGIVLVVAVAIAVVAVGCLDIDRLREGRGGATDAARTDAGPRDAAGARDTGALDAHTFDATLGPGGGASPCPGDWPAELVPASGGTVIIHALAPDGDGGVYVCGEQYLGFRVGETTTSEENAAFVLRLDASGRGVFAAELSSDVYASCLAIAAVPGDGVVVAGAYEGMLSVTGGPARSAVGGSDAFVAHFTQAGGFVGADGFGGTDQDAAYGVAVGTGTIYLAIEFRSPTISFPPMTSAPAIATDGQPEILVAAWGATVGVLAHSVYGGMYTQAPRAIAADGDRVYVAGFYDHMFAGLPAGTYGDGFVLALDAELNLQAAGAIGGELSDRIDAVAAHADAVWVGGMTASSMLVGGVNPSPGDDHGFLAAFDYLTFEPRSAHLLGGVGDDAVTALAIDGDELAAAGWFSGTADVGGPATAASGTDAFAVSLDLVGEAGPTQLVAYGREGNDHGRAVALSSGRAFVAADHVGAASVSCFSR